MIVVDANIIVYLLVPGLHTARAERALSQDPEWIAPLLWRSEFRNVLALYVRRNLFSLAEARDLMGRAEWLMAGNEYPVQSAHVLALASTSRCSAYDCEYVALAEEVGLPLVTTDRQLLAAFAGTAMSLEDFVA